MGSSLVGMASIDMELGEILSFKGDEIWETIENIISEKGLDTFFLFSTYNIEPKKIKRQMLIYTTKIDLSPLIAHLSTDPKLNLSLINSEPIEYYSFNEIFSRKTLTPLNSKYFK